MIDTNQKEVDEELRSGFQMEKKWISISCMIGKRGFCIITTLWITPAHSPVKILPLPCIYIITLTFTGYFTLLYKVKPFYPLI